MKRIGIITINDNNNYGNRLQNYAVQEYLKRLGFEVETLRNVEASNDKKKFILRLIKKKLKENKHNLTERDRCFKFFNNNIKFSENKITAFSHIKNKYDYFIVGSDQVWNPNIGRLRDVDLLSFADSKQRISLSASFGVNCISKEDKKKIKKELYKFKSISVREEAGKRIINDVLPRNDVEVLIDPTMLLTADEWDKVAKKPKQLDNLKNKRYILTYFLGNLSMDKKGKIEKIAQKNNCEIINILDKNSPFYQTGPSEFLYLEKNAILICTDSFHSCVFSILYNRPFLVFQREGNVNKMNSRIETLLNKFNLEDREVNENITDDKLKYDYSQAYKILENERDKTKIFIKNALDIK